MSSPYPSAVSRRNGHVHRREAGTVTGCSTRRRSRPPRPSSAPPIRTSRRSSRPTACPSSGPANRGFPTLVLLILEQQVSLASAKAAYDRLASRIGEVTPEGVLRTTDEELRADGFSRQKNRYVRALSTAIVERSLDLDVVASLDDDGVRTALVALPGIGPWTAEVYLLSALRRPDTWPIGDIALQEAARRARGLAERPSPDELDRIGEAWRPHRASAARLLWHLYLSEPRRIPSA